MTLKGTQLSFLRGLVKAVKNGNREKASKVSPNVVRTLVPAVRATFKKAVFAL